MYELNIFVKIDRRTIEGYLVGNAGFKDEIKSGVQVGDKRRMILASLTGISLKVDEELYKGAVTYLLL